MPVDRIKEIVKKILRLKYSLIAIILCSFILCISVYGDVATNNNKHTNFYEKNNENNNKDIETNLSYPSASDKLRIFMIFFGITVIVAVIIYCYFNHRRILSYLNNLYNRLFRRNQINEPEPAVHFQQNDGIQEIGQNIRENNGENNEENNGENNAENNGENVHQEQLLDEVELDGRAVAG